MMEKILFVDACVRHNSRTRALAQVVLQNLDGVLEHLPLYENPLPPLDLRVMAKRAEAAQSGIYEDPVFAHALQFAQADVIVIAAPFWDLMFPAVLKNYLEQITVSGITFRYTEKGIPTGLCRAKKLYYVTTAGGYLGEQNFGFAYVQALAKGFYGIDDVRCISAQGLDIAGNDANAILEEAKRAAQALQNNEKSESYAGLADEGRNN